MKAIRRFSFVRALMLVIATLGLSTAFAAAQTALQGSFTLPVEAHWQKAVLPAGEYTYKVEMQTSGPMVTVHSADLKWSAMFLARSLSSVTAGTQFLTLTNLGGEMFVTSFQFGQLGIVANYPAPKALEIAADKTQQPAMVASTH